MSYNSSLFKISVLIRHYGIHIWHESKAIDKSEPICATASFPVHHFGQGLFLYQVFSTQIFVKELGDVIHGGGDVAEAPAVETAVVIQIFIVKFLAGELVSASSHVLLGYVTVFRAFALFRPHCVVEIFLSKALGEHLELVELLPAVGTGVLGKCKSQQRNANGRIILASTRWTHPSFIQVMDIIKWSKILIWMSQSPLEHSVINIIVESAFHMHQSIYGNFVQDRIIVPDLT